MFNSFLVLGKSFSFPFENENVLLGYTFYQEKVIETTTIVTSTESSKMSYRNSTIAQVSWFSSTIALMPFRVYVFEFVYFYLHFAKVVAKCQIRHFKNPSKKVYLRNINFNHFAYIYVVINIQYEVLDI